MDDGFYRKVLDNLYDGVYFLDGERRVSYWNRGAEKLTGYPEAEAIGKACRDIFTHIGEEGLRLCDGSCPIEQTIREGGIREVDMYLRHRDGHLIPIVQRIASVSGSSDQMVVAVEIASDNSPRHVLKQQLEELQKLALTDQLTSLPNRRFIDMSLIARLEEVKRYNWSFGLLFIDVDHFKNINDTHGHEIGDRVLKMVAKTLMASIRPYDVVGRWGGEEFVVLLINVTDEQLSMIADRFRMLVEQSRFPLNRKQIQVTVSIGATLSRPDDTIETIVSRADTLMYQSKNDGRNRVTAAA